MLCARHARWRNSSALINFLQRSCYSRRNDNSTSSFKINNKANQDAFDDVEGTVLGADSNWELLTPSGFRFYLPGCVGPGWSDASTTLQRGSGLISFTQKNVQLNKKKDWEQNRRHNSRHEREYQIKCVAQECPLLLKNGINELFPGCRELLSCSQITIVTISQLTNFRRMQWNKELETERLAKNFILVASDICYKLKMIGFWADFINPFSGKPHIGTQKQNSLYATDKRFRCLGFKINHKNNCRVITCDKNMKNFKGNLFTSAPTSTDFFKEIVDDYVIVNSNQ